MSTFLHINAVAPQSLVMLCTPSDALPDMSAVTSSVIVCQKPTGVIVVWPVTLSSQTQTTLTITHQFAVGDVDVIGTYRCYPTHTVSGGQIRGEVTSFNVVGEFDFDKEIG